MWQSCLRHARTQCVRGSSLQTPNTGGKTGALAAIQSSASSADYDRFLFRIQSRHDFDGIGTTGFPRQVCALDFKKRPRIQVDLSHTSWNSATAINNKAR